MVHSVSPKGWGWWLGLSDGCLSRIKGTLLGGNASGSFHLPSMPPREPWTGLMDYPQILHWAPRLCYPLLFFFFSTPRLVWARATAEIQGDREDICQHRVQVLQLQRPPTVSTHRAGALPRAWIQVWGSRSSNVLASPPSLPRGPAYGWAQSKLSINVPFQFCSVYSVMLNRMTLTVQAADLIQSPLPGPPATLPPILQLRQ